MESHLSLIYKLYNTKLGKWLMKLSIIQWFLKRLSREVGILFSSPISEIGLREFKNVYWTPEEQIYLDAIYKPLYGDTYKSINDFFTRTFYDINIVRPLASSSFVSPADGSLSVYPYHPTKNDTIYIKGLPYDIHKLTDLAQTPHEKYTAVVVYLSPKNYHHFHAPCDGIITRIDHTGNTYDTVRPEDISSEIEVYDTNVRTIISIQCGNHVIFMIIVGSMIVGSITINEEIQNGYNMTHLYQLSKGQDMGYFSFGGSTVVSLLPSELLTSEPLRDRNITVRSSLSDLSIVEATSVVIVEEPPV